MSRRKITLMTRSLMHGGTERQLVTLAKGIHALGNPISVLSLYSQGPLREELLQAGIPCRSLAKKGRWDTLPFLLRLVSAIRAEQTDILYSFLAVPNLLSLLLKGLFPRIKTVWGIRTSGLDSLKLDPLGRRVQSLEARLSRCADVIITNSFAGLEYAVARGIPRGRMRVVHNGIDTDANYPDRTLGLRIRSKWNIQENEKLIGIVARLDLLKDHILFLKAATLLHLRRPDVRFVCVGGGSPEYADSLAGLARRLGIDRKIVWAGDCSDMLHIYNALDILTLCSETEGFPNALAEGMACGIPCVATNVGDCGRMIEGNGILVPSRTPEALSQAWEHMLETLPARGSMLAKEARERILERYPIDTLTARTLELLNAI
jgi:glycosyltransferase involved in cell wall biosynthesis